MPAFLSAVAAGILSNAALPVAARIRATLAQAGRVGGPRSSTRRAPQTAPPRVELTPPAWAGPPVPAGRPGTAALIAAKLAGRR